MRFEMKVVYGPPRISYPSRDKGIERAVSKIIEEVKSRGDDAVREFAAKFDGFKRKRFEVQRKRLESLADKVDSKVARALRFAHRRIKSFATEQKKALRAIRHKFSGYEVALNFVPVESVLCYIPGGYAPLPSTALMTLTPAKVAGVEHLFATTPKLTPEVAFAMLIAGADRVFEIGGAHAIAAFALGTESIPKVDMIVGPGGAYVTEAKRQLFGTVGIDMLAGPSEVCIVADETANPAYVAADLLAQAEHDPHAIPILLTTSESLAGQVNRELTRIASELKLGSRVAQALKNGGIFVLSSIDECIKEAQKLAPEHLELLVKNPRQTEKRLKAFGAIFVGQLSAEVFGDYASGTNHVLPTGASARFSSGLWVGTFMLARYRLEVDEPAQLAEISSALAEAEGLVAHKLAASIRKRKR